MQSPLTSLRISNRSKAEPLYLFKRLWLKSKNEKAAENRPPEERKQPARTSNYPHSMKQVNIPSWDLQILTPWLFYFELWQHADITGLLT